MNNFNNSVLELSFENDFQEVYFSQAHDGWLNCCHYK